MGIKSSAGCRIIVGVQDKGMSAPPASSPRYRTFTHQGRKMIQLIPEDGDEYGDEFLPQPLDEDEVNNPGKDEDDDLSYFGRREK